LVDVWGEHHGQATKKNGRKMNNPHREKRKKKEKKNIPNTERRIKKKQDKQGLKYNQKKPTPNVIKACILSP